jgi:hypothetical protein
MKSIYALVAVVSVTTFSALAAELTTRTAPQVIEKGPHHRVWSHVTTNTTPDGQAVLKTNRYTELATGLHYRDQNGEWSESQEVIDIVPGGALASKGSHQVGFAANANTPGAVNMLTSDGKRLRSHVLGLTYISTRTAESLWIARIRDSIGERIGENQILYRDAFDDGGHGTKADIRYTYTRAGLEQDIIFRPDGAPPPPEAFGLDSDDVRLEVITEFVEAPVPHVADAILSTKDQLQRAALVLPDFVDQTIDFGAMRMEAGHAFPIKEDPQPQERIRTGKLWYQQDGRTFLIEAVEYPSIKPQLDSLRVQPNVQQAQFIRNSDPTRTFPTAPLQANARDTIMRTASLSKSDHGFVIDYELLGGATNVTLRADTTYLVRGTVAMRGTTVIEGGCVIKYTNLISGPQLRLDAVDCRTSPYHPAIATSVHDDTVGDIISGSTGNPTNFCSFAMFLLVPTAPATNFNFHDIRIRHAYRAFFGFAKNSATISNCQIANSHVGFHNNVSFWNLRNVLVSDVEEAFAGVAPHTNNAENVTFHSVSNLVGSGLPAINLTNSLLIGVTNGVSWTGANVETNLSSTGIFQTIGSANFYLATNSPYRAIGTTNINATLLAGLRERTTFPPVPLSGAIPTNLTLAPVISRDMNADGVDLGYHYDPIDYLFEGVSVTNATLTLTNGVCIAVATNSATGIRIDLGGRIVSDASPLALNRLFRTSAVQEQRASNSTSLGFAFLLANNDAMGTNSFRFTDFPLVAGIDAIVYTNSGGAFTFADCQFRGGRIETYGGLTFLATNTLFERVHLSLDSGATAINAGVYNCLVRGGPTTALRNHVGLTTVEIFNTLFDSVGTIGYDTATGSTNAFNGYYLTTVLPSSVGAVVLTNLTYQTGSLGRYYQPTNSPLLNAGSGSATNFGLYHYTVTTNNVKETNSTVDIGLHYIAVNAGGVPLDTDGDGVSDYWEDRNGNGSHDTGEINWQDSDTDDDGVPDGVELLQGRNPMGGTVPDTYNTLNLRVYTPLK